MELQTGTSLETTVTLVKQNKQNKQNLETELLYHPAVPPMCMDQKDPVSYHEDRDSAMFIASQFTIARKLSQHISIN